MQVIYKYKLEGLATRIQLPADYKILTVALQNDEPHVWIEHSSGAELTKTITIRVFATGEEFYSSIWHYIKTLFTGNFVYHFYYTEI